MEELRFQFSPFWVQIHNIPLNRINKENVVSFVNFIGSFLKIDKSLEENKVKSYLLVQVNVDTTKALKTSAFIKNDDGSMRWLAFKYERLSDFYFVCGRLGHVDAGC